MAAWDNVQLPSAPSTKDYGPPAVDFSQFSSIPDSYFKGTQEALTLAKQNAFKNGLPTDQNGNVDWNAVTQKMIQLGGTDAIPGYLALQLKQQALNQPNNYDSIVNGAPQQPQAPQQQPAAPVNIPAHGIPEASNPNDVPSGTKMPPGQNLADNSTTGYKVDYGPVQNGPLPQTAQNQPQQTSLPPNVSEAAASNLDRAAAYFLNRADKKEIAFGRGGGDADRAQAAALTARAKQMRDLINENSKLTEKQKDLSSGATAGTKLTDLTIEQGQKTYAGIHAQATQYERDLKPYLDLSRSIVNDPRMYSGAGGNISLNINRVRALLGDQQAAQLQEGLKKITASSVLGQINQQRDQLQEAGGTSSRIFQQQVKLVEQAAPALENTLAGNRFLIEVSSRMGQLSSTIDQMARDYKADPKHPYLDAGFDQQAADYMKAHPAFTPQEMSHPEILGAATVPPGMVGNKAAIIGWGKSLGLKSGDPIRFPGGVVKALP